MHLHRLLARLPASQVAQVGGRGLRAGVQLAAGQPSARVICERLLSRRVLAKDAHDATIRIAPPLVMTAAELEWGVEQLAASLDG